MKDVREAVVELEHADDGNKDEKDTAVLVAKLPCSGRLQDLSLTLGKARLTVPVAITAGAFNALTDMFLSYARINSAAGDDVRLSCLLWSSCSPRLRPVAAPPRRPGPRLHSPAPSLARAACAPNHELRRFLRTRGGAKVFIFKN
jgi:hypothetical protein